MPNFDISGLVKVLVLVIFTAISVGQFPRLRDFAIREGLKAVTMSDYRPTYFSFPGESTDRAKYGPKKHSPVIAPSKPNQRR